MINAGNHEMATFEIFVLRVTGNLQGAEKVPYLCTQVPRHGGQDRWRYDTDCVWDGLSNAFQNKLSYSDPELMKG